MVSLAAAGLIRRLRHHTATILSAIAVAISGSLIAPAASLAQSGAVIGATLDPQEPTESLLPIGSFSLDGPANDSPAPSDDEPAAAATSLGLQIYGAGFSSLPMPNADAESPVPGAPLPPSQP